MARIGWSWMAVGWCMIASSACGDSHTDAPASPIPAHGGDEAAAQQALCTAFAACGGEVIGAWDVAAVCFENPEVLLPASSEPACADVVRGGMARAAGRYEFDEEGMTTTDLRVEVDFDTLWSDACVAALAGDESLRAADLCADLEAEYRMQTDTLSAATCQVEDEGCACAISTRELSEMGEGAYVTATDTLNGDPYCVEEDTLRLSVTAMGLTGIIVLDRR